MVQIMILYFLNFEVSDLAYLRRKLALAYQSIRNPQDMYQGEGAEKMFIFRYSWRNSNNVPVSAANTDLLNHFPVISLFAMNL